MIAAFHMFVETENERELLVNLANVIAVREIEIKPGIDIPLMGLEMETVNGARIKCKGNLAWFSQKVDGMYYVRERR